MMMMVMIMMMMNVMTMTDYDDEECHDDGDEDKDCHDDANFHHNITCSCSQQIISVIICDCLSSI